MKAKLPINMEYDRKRSQTEDERRIVIYSEIFSVLFPFKFRREDGIGHSSP